MMSCKGTKKRKKKVIIILKKNKWWKNMLKKNLEHIKNQSVINNKYLNLIN